MTDLAKICFLKLGAIEGERCAPLFLQIFRLFCTLSNCFACVFGPQAMMKGWEVKVSQLQKEKEDLVANLQDARSNANANKSVSLVVLLVWNMLVADQWSCDC